jgi:F-type H+-transporting ATPase subunit b
MLWGAIAFFGLYLLVRFVLLPPVQGAMAARQATIEADRDAADLAKAQIASADSELADQLAGVREQAGELIETARSEGEAERRRLIERAEREVSAMHDVAAGEIAREREEALAAVRPQVADLAVGAASKVMGRQVNLDEARPVIDRHLNSPN